MEKSVVKFIPFRVTVEFTLWNKNSALRMNRYDHVNYAARLNLYSGI